MSNRVKKFFTPGKILAIVAAFCALLIVVSFFSDRLVTPLRGAVSQVIIPIQRGMNGIGIGVVNRENEKRNIEDLQEENRELKDTIALLEEENKQLKHDTKDLDSLKKLYEIDKKYSSYPKTGATIIGTTSQNWNTSFVIDKGSNNGIKPDMNVVSDEGLVGMISEVHANYSIVSTVIGDNSFVSAMDEATGDHCTVRGDISMMDGGFVSLERIKQDANINDGDSIVTSAISSKYLQGILIGYAKDVKQDGNGLTKSGHLVPAVDFEHLQKVLVITQLREFDNPETQKEGEEGETQGSGET